MNKVSTLKKKAVSLPSFKSLKDIDIPVKMKPESAFNDLVLTTRDGAVQWLEANIRRARDEGVIVVEEILSAAIARELLDRNPENRPVSAVTVAEMANAMRVDNGPAGFNGMNGETIKISACGLLNDGQHRCHARLDANVDIRTRFMFGLPREARLTIDQGKLRRAGDYLAIEGFENGSQAAMIAVLLYYWRTRGTIKKPHGGLVGGKTLARPGASKVSEYAKENYVQIRRTLDVVPREGCGQLGGFAMIGFAHLVFGEKDFGAATDFIERLVKGTDLSERSPILVCRQRLLSGTRLRREERWELILRAWNAYRENRELAYLAVRGDQPKIAD
jgi:hypothetical protein